MTSKDVARNVSQRAGAAFRVQGRIVNANTGIYTVPTGKRARITDMLGNLNAVGGDATYAIAVKRFIGGAFIELTNPKAADVDQLARLVVLESQDILTDIGDAGSTNGTFDLAATIEEFTR